MSLHVVNHPVAEHALSFLRAKQTSAAEYRALCKRVFQILLTKALENLEMYNSTVDTPICECQVRFLKNRTVFVPVLRAGLAALSPALEFLPEASVGYFGLQRNEITATPEFYYSKLPEISNTDVFVLDPMLATGGSCEYVFERLNEMNAKTLSLISVIAAQEGIDRILKKFPSVNIYTVAVDEKLNDQKFIVPGLGDFGDRFNGTV